MKVDFSKDSSGFLDNDPTPEEIRNEILDDLACNVRVILEMLNGSASKEEIAEYIVEFLVKQPL